MTLLDGPEGRHSNGAANKLLEPVGVAQLISEYWGKRALHIEGKPGKFEDIFSRRTFEAMLEREAATPRDVQIAYNPGVAWLAKMDQRPELPSHFILEPNEVPGALLNGGTLRVSPVEPVLALERALKSEMGYAGGIDTALWHSSPGEGARAHFDAASVLVLQIEGSKQWRISSQPALAWPHTAGRLSPDGELRYNHTGAEWAHECEPPRDEHTIQITCNPGDLLFIPAGTWHETLVVGDEDSLSINIMFRPVSFRDLFREVMDETLASNPAWRHLPAVPVSAGNPGGLAQNFASFCRNRLQDLKVLIARLEANDFELNRAYKKLVAKSDSASALPQSTDPIVQGDTLCVTDAVVTYADGQRAEGMSELSLYWGENELTFDDPALLGFARMLAKRRRFGSAEVLEWADGVSDWETARDLLEELRSVGFLSKG